MAETRQATFTLPSAGVLPPSWEWYVVVLSGLWLRGPWRGHGGAPGSPVVKVNFRAGGRNATSQHSDNTQTHDALTTRHEHDTGPTVLN